MLLHLINYPQIVDQYDFSTIEAFHVGAAPVSESLSEAVRQKFNIPVLQVRFIIRPLLDQRDTKRVLLYIYIYIYIYKSLGLRLD